MYIRKTIIERAKRHIRFHKCSMDYQLSKFCYVKFGIVGLTLTRICKNGEYRKQINGWQDMAASALNRAINEMQWEKNNG